MPRYQVSGDAARLVVAGHELVVLHDRQRVQHVPHLPLVVSQKSDEIRSGQLQLQNLLRPLDRSKLGAKVAVKVDVEGLVVLGDDEGLQKLVEDRARHCLLDGLLLSARTKRLQHPLAFFGDSLQAISRELALSGRLWVRIKVKLI